MSTVHIFTQSEIKNRSLSTHKILYNNSSQYLKCLFLPKNTESSLRTSNYFSLQDINSKFATASQFNRLKGQPSGLAYPRNLPYPIELTHSAAVHSTNRSAQPITAKYMVLCDGLTEGHLFQLCCGFGYQRCCITPGW